MESEHRSRVSQFMTTRWSLVVEAAEGSETEALEGLAELCRIYWPPLYRYVRRTGKSPQDAEDLVQGFFAMLLEKESLRLVEQGQGRFRAFLLAVLKNYMAKQWRWDHRVKRGGFAEHLSMDWESAEEGLRFEPEDTRSPDKLFDQDWARTLLEKVLDDLSTEEGRSFARWKEYLSVQSEHIPYAELAQEFGMTEGAVRVAVHRLRKRYRRRLKEEIGRTLLRAEAVEDEFRSLLAALREE